VKNFKGFYKRRRGFGPVHKVGVAAPAVAPVNTSLPNVIGTAQEGQTLTAGLGAWTNSPLTYTYQWKRNGVAISGSINSTRVLTSADVGATMTVTVTASNNGGSTSATSAATATVTAASPGLAVNTVAPVISGDPHVGGSLASTDGTWTGTVDSFTYQWRRDGVNISGATNNTYTAQLADVGAAVTCRVGAVNAGGTAPAISNAITGVAAAPANSTAPAITGVQQPSEVLTVSDGTWTNSPTSFTYQWKKDGTNIGGAMANTYTVQLGDIGGVITCAVTATSAAGSTTVSSGGLTIVNPPFYGTYTIKPSQITGTLTNFPVYIDLGAVMPSGFWSAIRSTRMLEGGNVRVYTSAGVRCAVDIAGCNPVLQTGHMFFKAPSASVGSQFIITCENALLTQPAIDQAYGRNAVWSAYQHVYLFGRNGGVDRTGRKDLAFVAATASMKLATVGTDLDTLTYYQGVAWNPVLGEYMNTGTNNVRRITDNGDGTFTTLQTKNTPWTGAGSANIASVTNGHNGGCEWYDAPGVPGGVYVWSIATGNGYGDYYLTVWKASDLTFLGKTQMGGGAANTAMGGDYGAADIARNPADGKWYCAQFTNALSLSRWTLDESTWTFTFDAKIDISTSRTDVTFNAASFSYQGIAFHKGHVYLHDNQTFRLHRYTLEGTTLKDGDTVYVHPGTPAEAENLTVREDYLVALLRTTSSATKVRRLVSNTIEKGASGSAWISGSVNSNAPRIEVNGVVSLSSFTMATTVVFNNSISSTIRAAMTYGKAGPAENAAATTGEARMTLARRSNGQVQIVQTANAVNTITAIGTGTNPVTTVNGSGSATPDTGTAKRYALVMDSTAPNARLICDGVSSGNLTMPAFPATADRLLFGMEDLDGANAGSLHVAFSYLYPGTLSDTWLAAEFAMVNSPTGFGAVV
jgi:hypothetical protein